ncbi:DUF3343 domain-containing protein [Clostridium intestinale]|uniref:Putative Se/S carrier protein-like domain-containing protein n=1 Tax=Clostridium intestinale DSM 6191 TaxID=1121320 RepID=A0A1M5YHG1_9CLOT|nr:DUF3343 domain-containing protein [Clostridium intestinale]SHI11436.1 Protein of unknown function [Clostridium intestinale DSM 6191]
MNEEIFNLIAFNSTSNAIRAEKELKLNDIEVKVLPVPRDITASCGLSIRIKTEDLEKAMSTLKEENIDVAGYYNVSKIGLNRNIEKIEL